MKLKSIISVVLSFNMAFLSPYIALAGSGDDAEAKANKIIELSHEGAKGLAEDLFRFYLLNGIHDSFKNNVSLMRVVDAVNEVNSKLASRLQEVNNVEFGIEEAIEVAEDEWSSNQAISKSLQKAMRAYQKALVELKLSQYKTNVGSVVSDYARESVLATLKHFKGSCEQGVSAQFIVPNLPPISIRPPDFNFGFQFNVSSDGKYVNSAVGTSVYGNPSFETIFAGNDDAGAYGAALSALTYVGAYNLAIASGFAAESAGAYAIGGLYFIAVMIIVYIGMDAHQKGEAKQQATAVSKSVYYKANATHVAQYYRELCSVEGASLLTLANKIENGEALTAPSAEDLEFVKSIFNKINELNEAVAGVEKELKDKGLSGKVLEGKVEESDEFKARIKYVKEDLGTAGITRALSTQLTSLVVDAKKTSELIEQGKFVSEGDISMKSLRDKLKEMQGRMKEAYVASYRQSMTPENIEALKADFLKNEESGVLYLRWQKLYGQYLYEQFHGKPTAQTLEKISALLIDMDNALLLYPNSQAISIMKQRLSGFLGEL